MTNDGKTDVLLIDLSHIFRTHWHATEGQEVGEAFSRTVEQVNRIASGYPLVAVACDAPPYRRSDISADYKAQRKEPPPMLAEQLRRTEERLKADGFLLWKATGYEADDIIATAVYRAFRDEPPLSVTIASNDKDLFQLVNDAAGVRALHPMSGSVFTEKEVLEKMGVPPRLLADSLALQGDKSDNIAGLPGCGPVNSAKLLEKYGNLEGLLQGYRTLDSDRWRKLVADNVDRVRLARRLVTLCDDAPIDWDSLFEKRQKMPLVARKPIDAEFDEVGDDSDLDVLGTPPAHIPLLRDDEENVASSNNSEAKSDETKPDQGTEPVRPKPLRPDESTALAVVPSDFALQLEPRSPAQAVALATKLFESRLFGQFGTPEAVLAIILRGRSLGMDAVTSLANFHVVEGKPVMHAALIVGLVLRSGKADYFELTETSSERAVWETFRKGNKKPTSIAFTIQDAHYAGLVTCHNGEYRGVSKSGRPSNWDKYRSTMLQWRAAVQLARVVYPDVVTGLYTPDELSDGQSEHV